MSRVASPYCRRDIPDNDVLLYWPLHDLWHNRPDAYMLEISGHWLQSEPFGQTAQRLWDGGYQFDYVSDRQLTGAKVVGGKIQLPGGEYAVIVVPPCTVMPIETLEALLEIQRQGGTVSFVAGMPSDVPGFADLNSRRERLVELRRAFQEPNHGDLFEQLMSSAARREIIADNSCVSVIRRRTDDGVDYFIANQGQAAIDGWVPLNSEFASAVIANPMTGSIGIAACRIQRGNSEVYLQLAAGESVVVRTLVKELLNCAPWQYVRCAGEPHEVAGAWRIEFVDGGPVLPGTILTDRLAFWTEFGVPDADRFAGTAKYSVRFNRPQDWNGEWLCSLGEVAESARVTLNGEHTVTCIAGPFEVRLPALLPSGNILEIEVSNLAANRIRDMDRRGETWRIFREINFVDRSYKPFDASNWPVRASGLKGPVMLTPIESFGRVDSQEFG